MVQTPLIIAAVVIVYLVITTLCGDSLHTGSVEIKLLGCSITLKNIRRDTAGLSFKRQKR